MSKGATEGATDIFDIFYISHVANSDPRFAIHSSERFKIARRSINMKALNESHYTAYRVLSKT